MTPEHPGDITGGRRGAGCPPAPGSGYDGQELRAVARRFQEARTRTALAQVATTFPPLLALFAAMYAGRNAAAASMEGSSYLRLPGLPRW